MILEVIFWFAGAVFFLILGHVFKMLRWKQFIEVYEETGRKPLLRSLIIGYIINFFVPFRVGDAVRAILTGRRLKNGTGFALATVVVDRYLDVLVVGILFSVMSFCGMVQPDGMESTVFYSCFSVALLIGSVLAIRYSAYLKKFTKWFCQLFNAQIEFSILFFFWSAISAFKDIYTRLSKKQLVLMTSFMWGFYLLSYYAMAVFTVKLGYSLTFTDVFLTLFSRNNLDVSFIQITSLLYGTRTLPFYLSLYIALPLFILLLASFIPHAFWKKIDAITGKEVRATTILQLLPQVSQKERLQFLEQYFSSTNREFLQKYLELNRNIRIIEDYSAGSNATTMLCMDEHSMFYRKYAFGKDGDKLYEQLEWLHAHENTLVLPQILREQRSKDFCCYDMTYDSAAVGLFHLIHSDNPERVWDTLQLALDDMSAHLHSQNVHAAPIETVKKYIEQKIWSNINKIKESREIKPLFEYEALVINGKNYKNLSALMDYFNCDYLCGVFQNDIYAEIHGDLTVENIICWESDKSPPYYFIDPNTGNLHESPALDYAKLLQSLHGGYEFLMRTPTVSVNGNHINFLFTRSQSYYDIFCKYRSYLELKFDEQQVRSIFFHEVVHWLRLMPYKIDKNGKRAILFYAGMIMVLNDVIGWYVAPNNNNIAFDKI